MLDIEDVGAWSKQAANWNTSERSDGVAHDDNSWSPYDEEIGKFKFKFREGRKKPVSLLGRPGEDAANGGARGMVHGTGGGSAGNKHCIGGDTGEIGQNINGGREIEDGNNAEAGRMEDGNAIGDETEDWIDVGEWWMEDDIVGRAEGNLKGIIIVTGDSEDGINGSVGVVKGDINDGVIGMEDDTNDGVEEFVDETNGGAGGIESGICGAEEIISAVNKGVGGIEDGISGGTERIENPIRGDFAGMEHEASMSAFTVGFEHSGIAFWNLFSFRFFLNLFLGSLGSEGRGLGIMNGGIMNLSSP